VGRKKAEAISFCPAPRMLTANFPVRSIRACRWLSLLIPTITRGGWKEAWEGQLMVPAAISSPSAAVSTYRP
jgi:hypothetical protein